MTPQSRRRLDPTGKSGVRIAFSRCRRHHAAEPACFSIKNELVAQRGEHDIAKTQYVCYFTTHRTPKATPPDNQATTKQQKKQSNQQPQKQKLGSAPSCGRHRCCCLPALPCPALPCPALPCPALPRIDCRATGIFRAASF